MESGGGKVNNYQNIYLSNVIKANLTPPYDDKEMRKLVWEMFGIQLDDETIANLRHTLMSCPTCGV